MAPDPIWPPRPEQLRPGTPPAPGEPPSTPFWGGSSADPFAGETTIAPANQQTQIAGFPRTAVSANPVGGPDYAPTAVPVSAVSANPATAPATIAHAVPVPPAAPAPATAVTAEPPRRGKGIWLVLLSVLAIGALAAAIIFTLRPAPQAVVTVYQAGATSAAGGDTAPATSAPATMSAPASSPAATKTSVPSPSKSSTTASASSSPTPTETTPAEALAKLSKYHDDDAAAVSPKGQWVASLASKWVGVTDPLQTTRSGSHTFGAVDILNEHETLRSADNKGATVRLIYAGDYGTQQTHNGDPIYVTVATNVGSSRAEVAAWCQQRYPDKSGSDLDNLCMPLQLNPKR